MAAHCHRTALHTHSVARVPQKDQWTVSTLVVSVTTPPSAAEGARPYADINIYITQIIVNIYFYKYKAVSVPYPNCNDRMYQIVSVKHGKTNIIPVSCRTRCLAINCDFISYADFNVVGLVHRCLKCDTGTSLRMYFAALVPRISLSILKRQISRSCKHLPPFRSLPCVYLITGCSLIVRLSTWTIHLIVPILQMKCVSRFPTPIAANINVLFYHPSTWVVVSEATHVLIHSRVFSTNYIRGDDRMDQFEPSCPWQSVG